MKWFSAALVCLVGAGTARPADAPAPPSDGELVRRLADPDYKTREAATAELKKRPRAVELVRKAAQADDPKAVRRAEEILPVMAKAIALERVPQLKAFAADRLVDCFTEALVQFPDRNSDAPWEAMTAFGYAVTRELHKWPRQEFDLATKYWPDEKFADFAKREKLRRVYAGDEPAILDVGILFRGPWIRTGPERDIAPLVACSERFETSYLKGFAYVNGRVDVSHSSGFGERALHSSVVGLIVGDGDVVFDQTPTPEDTIDHRSAGDCIIVARGNVVLPAHTACVIVLAGGNVTFPEGGQFFHSVRCGGKVIRLGKNPNLRNGARVSVIENDPKALGPFKFFEFATVGLTAKAAFDKSLSVTELDAKSPLLQAGLAKGDAILEVDGAAPKTPEGLRKLLRSGYVRGDAKVKVRRGQETKEFAVLFPLPVK